VVESRKLVSEERMGQPHANRRSLLKLGGASLAGAALPLSSGTGADARAAQGQAKSFRKVDVAEDRITRKIAGLRPFRPSGFVVRVERLGEKTMIHNYGHGGCGVTLSWGTADMAARLALETPYREAAVIGCGAVGLATARLLQDRGFEVVIYAKDIPPNTTSSVAAALFGVTSLVDDVHHAGEIVGRIQQAARFAHRYYQNFVGDRYGIRWIEFFLIGDQPQEQPWDFAITPELYPLTVIEPGDNPFPARYASRFPSMLIETNIYLPRLLADFLLRGGKLHVRDFAHRAELAGLAAPLIVNCTGLGAKALFDDQELTPIKGQLTLLLPQADVNYVYLDGARDLYMFPRRDAIILGGSHEQGAWSTEPDETQAARIFDGHKQIAAGMR
jgi:glycine/D-amino acid oxidase-like deaminating enzyme